MLLFELTMHAKVRRWYMARALAAYLTIQHCGQCFQTTTPPLATDAVDSPDFNELGVRHDTTHISGIFNIACLWIHRP